MAPDDLPFRFRCRRSGNCCARPGGVVRVGPEDVRRIAGHLGMSEEAFRSRFVAARGDRLATAPGDRCVFLEDGTETACAIHPVRPARCRSWPFWPELLASDDALAEACRLCPGIERRPPSPGREADRERQARRAAAAKAVAPL